MLSKEEILDFLKAHKQEFKEKYGVEEIALFGSYVHNRANEKSDIDIIVQMPSKFDSYYNLKEYLEEKFQKKVDLGLKKSLRTLVAKEIERDIVYV